MNVAYEIAQTIDEIYGDEPISGADFAQTLEERIQAFGQVATIELKKEVLKELKEIRRIRIGAVV